MTGYTPKTGFPLHRKLTLHTRSWTAVPSHAKISRTVLTQPLPLDHTCASCAMLLTPKLSGGPGFP